MGLGHHNSRRAVRLTWLVHNHSATHARTVHAKLLSGSSVLELAYRTTVICRGITQLLLSRATGCEEIRSCTIRAERFFGTLLVERVLASRHCMDGSDAALEAAIEQRRFLSTVFAIRLPLFLDRLLPQHDARDSRAMRS